jgi:hypothetical protein
MDMDVAEEQLSPVSGDGEPVAVGSKRLASSGVVIHASTAMHISCSAALLPYCGAWAACCHFPPYS